MKLEREQRLFLMLEGLLAEPSGWRESLLQSLPELTSFERTRLRALLQSSAEDDERMPLDRVWPGTGLPESAMDAQVLPRRCGEFMLSRRIGCGAMGEVFEATHLPSGRLVALKLLRGSKRHSEPWEDQLRDEAQRAASISHPRCVFTLGSYATEDGLAVAMELVTGSTLAKHVQTAGRLSIGEAVRLTVDVVDGLEAALLSGVIHRDVKPSNCFLDDEGRAKVGDFGIARAVGGPLDATSCGQFVGTMGYAAPEQVRGEPLDFRADLYSVGALLYFLLTGLAPIAGAKREEVRERVLAGRLVPLRNLRPDVPHELAAIVHRALDRRPERRFGSYKQLRQALRPYCGTKYFPARWSRRTAAYAVDVLLVQVVVAVVIGILSSRASMPGVTTPLARELNSGLQAVLGSPLARSSLLIICVLIYFVLFEVASHTTIGKRVFGMRLLQGGVGMRASGAIPLRALIVGGTAGAVLLAAGWLIGPADTASDALTLAALGIAPGLLFLRLGKHAHGEGLHDRATGVSVVEIRRAEPEVAQVARADGRWRQPLERLEAAVDGYSIVEYLGPTPDGDLCRAHELDLLREVWLHLRREARETSSVPVSSARLHLIKQMPWQDETCEVWEAPGGVALTEYARLRREEGTRTGNPLQWSFVRQCLLDLCADMKLRAAPLRLQQLWIDRWGRMRILGFPVGAVVGPELPALELLREVVACLLQPSADQVMHAGRRQAVIELSYVGVPSRGRRALSRLIGAPSRFENVQEFESELLATEIETGGDLRWARIKQLSIAAIGPLVALGGIIALSAASADGAWTPHPGATVGLLFLLPILAGMSAIGFQGGCSFALAGLEVQSCVGLRASHRQSVARALAPWWSIPGCTFVTVTLANVVLHDMGTALSTEHVFLAYLALWLVWSVSSPESGPADAIARTKVGWKGTSRERSELALRLVREEEAMSAPYWLLLAVCAALFVQSLQSRSWGTLALSGVGIPLSALLLGRVHLLSVAWRAIVFVFLIVMLCTALGSGHGEGGIDASVRNFFAVWR